MDTIMSSVPTIQSGTTNTASTGKGSSKGAASTDSFSALLAGQTNQASATGEGQPTDLELSMSMMLQMLHTLVSPIQPIAQQGEVSQSDEANLPELLIEAMNSNPALSETLLQDPKLKKWFENADEMLGALGNSTATGPASNASMLPFLMQQPTITESSEHVVILNDVVETTTR